MGIKWRSIQAAIFFFIAGGMNKSLFLVKFMFKRKLQFQLTTVVLFVLFCFEQARAGSIIISAKKAIGFSGTVHVISVGIDKYPLEGFVDLKFCESDARKFVDRLGMDSSVDLVSAGLLTGVDATKENIRTAFENMARAAGPEDIFIFYAAANGIDGNILLADSSLISSAELYTWSQPILTSKQLFFLDICHGEVFNAHLKKHILSNPELSAICRQNRVVLSVKNLAMENEVVGGGVFTAAYVRSPGIRISHIFSESPRIRTEFLYDLYNADSLVRLYKSRLDIEYFSEKELNPNMLEVIPTRGGSNFVLAKTEAEAGKRIKLGETLCLVVGISAYNNFSRLNNAVPDAVDIRKVLSGKYNTQTIYLEDANYEQFKLKLVEILNEYEFEEGSQFLLYVAGHGAKNELGEGCLLLKDAIRQNGILENAMALTSIKRFVGQLGCTNSIILMDICHSGTMFEEESCMKPTAIAIPKTNPIYNNKGIAVKNFLNQKTKIFIGSSNDQEAADGVQGHSPFAKVVLKFLDDNSLPVMDSYYLQENIRDNVMKENAVSIPQFCMYGGCKDDGRFMFFLR